MSNNVINQKKELFYLKIKSSIITKDNKIPQIKRQYERSNLNDFDKFSNVVKNAIINLERTLEIQNLVIIIILHHPILTDIYIYSKEQWNLYYNYDIIQQCINNDKLEIRYGLLEKFESIKDFRKNKRKIIKYILQNASLKLYSKILVKFLKENEKIGKQFEKFFIEELINETPDKIKRKPKKDDNMDDIDMNLNINNIILNEETEESSGDIPEKKIPKQKLYPKLDEEYLLCTQDFLKILENQYQKFSEKQENLHRIKEIIRDENNYYKIENDKNELKTSITFNLEGSGHFFGDDNFDNINKRNNVLLTQLNPPPNYIKKLLDDNNFFKKIDKEEYYVGIEQFKDDINRKLLDSSKELE